MAEYKNPEVFKVSGDKMVTVSIEVSVAGNASDETAMLNAAEALKFYAQNKRAWKSWAKKIVVR